MKSRLDKILEEHYLGGEKGYWYFHIELGSCIEQGGYFYYKKDAMRDLRDAVLKNFGDRSIAEEFLSMRHR